MKKKAKTIRKVLPLLLAVVLLVSTIVLSYPTEKEITEKHYIELTPQTNKVEFIELPTGTTFKNYEVISKTETKTKVSEVPKQTFYTTETVSGKTVDIERVYNEPFTLDVIKKGKKEVIRVFVPSKYYDTDYEFSNNDITLRVYYEQPTFQPMDYEPQNPDYEYVIITNESFWEIAYNNYKDWKISTDNKINNILIINVSTILNQTNCSVNGTWGDGTVSDWISEGKQVTSDWEMFNDSQAKIRNFLRYCYTIHGTRYALLFGNKNVVPPRMACSYAVGTCPGCTGWYNETSHASDMYYSCLHYNMNNNTNSYWMENAVCGSPVDEIDWGYDMHVGRVLVSHPFEGYYWINKTKNYVANNQSNYTSWNVVPCKNVTNTISNQTWNGYYEGWFGPSIGKEFPENMSFINGQNITQAQWSILDDYANGNAGGIPGFVMIYHAGHGGTLFDPYKPSNLNNYLTPNFVFSEGCHTGDFGEDTTSRMEDWMSDDGCAFGGIINSAWGWFVASTYYGEQFMHEIFNDSNTTILCEALENAKEVVGHDPDCVWGMIVKEMNFFGDPALEWVWYEEPSQSISIDSINGGANMTTISDSTPIFNWTKIDNVTKYWLQISSSPAFETQTVNLSNISIYEFPIYYSESETNVSFELPNIYKLTLYGTYYVKVRYCVKEQ